MRRIATIGLLVGTLATALTAVFAPGHAGGASSEGTVVTATVPSATSLDASGCAASTANVTDFGAVLPTTAYVTSGSCAVLFGSSNDTAQLRIAQADGFGAALYQQPPGPLDSGFSGDGKVVQAVGPVGNFDDARAILPLSDGKVVIAGSCTLALPDSVEHCLLRYATDGTLDTSFDGDGILTYSIGGAWINDEAFGAALLPDGRMVVAGRCYMGVPTRWDTCLARLAADGSFDAGFDTDGMQLTAINATGDDGAEAVVVGSDLTTTVGGSCDTGGASGIDICIARYTSAGALDTTFDTDGMQQLAVGGGAGTDIAYAAALQSDGKLVVAGGCDLGGATGIDICVARYTSAGALDTTFDSDGIRTIAIAAGAFADRAYAIALQPDGRIVVGGECAAEAAGESDFCIARLTTSGGLDATFDGDGIVTTDFGVGGTGDLLRLVSVLDDGRIVAGGQCFINVGVGDEACAARYASTGALDTTFDGDGRVAHAPSAGSDTLLAGAVRPDGGLYIAGRCNMGATGWDICAVSFAGGATFSQYTDGVSDWDTASTTSMFGACLQSVATGASATWTVPGGGCTASDGAWWNAVPTTSAKVAYTAVSTTENATANLRFGLRAAAAQPPGTYGAAITLDVLAPNV